MLTGCAHCWSYSQVVLMLKSSDRIVHDLEMLDTCNLHLAGVSHHPTAPTIAASSQSAVHDSLPAKDAAASAAAVSESTSSASLVTASDSGCVKMGATLTLRRFTDIRPEDEFRCFVRGRRLVAACQRDVSQHFPQLAHLSTDAGSSTTHSASSAHDTASPSVQQALLEFHLRVVAERFQLQDCE